MFSNCFRYNGTESRVGEMCKTVQNEFRKQYAQLNFSFYITDPDFENEFVGD